MKDNLTQKRKPELLMPASSLEVLKTAVAFGADAVYIGGEAFGLRAKAKNFDPEEMAEGIAFAHAHGVKVYVTANILAHNDDLAGAADYFVQLRDMKPQPCDALIISDPGMFSIAKRVWPSAEIHISTQANNTNYETYLFWWELGAKRVVSARELSVSELKTIREHIPQEMEIESFVHGAMCISYSGRCLLSNYFAGRDANRGACTHPCRWKYTVMEETRPGEYMPVFENERGTYIFNSKDLCMVGHIPELVDAGIDSFKVEGRMKTALYVAAITRAYRRAIDDFFRSEELYRENMGWYTAEVSKCTNRRYTTGFYFGRPDGNTQIYDSSTYVNEYIYLGTVEEVCSRSAVGWRSDEESAAATGRKPGEEGGSAVGQANVQGSAFEAQDTWMARISQRNKFSVGDTVEIMRPDGKDEPAVVMAMYDEFGAPLENCPHPQQTIWLELSAKAERYDLLRVENRKVSE